MTHIGKNELNCLIFLSRFRDLNNVYKVTKKVKIRLYPYKSYTITEIGDLSILTSYKILPLYIYELILHDINFPDVFAKEGGR